MKICQGFIFLFLIFAHSLDVYCQSEMAQPETSRCLTNQHADCGFSADFIKERQAHMMGMSPLLPAHGVHEAGSILECGQFTIEFEDVNLNNGYGFDDPESGAVRQNTLCAAFEYVASMIDIHPDANIDVFIVESVDISDGWLARAGSYYVPDFGSVPGIYNGYTYDHILSGIDPDPAMYDMHIEFNFGQINIDGNLYSVEYIEDYQGDALVRKYDLFTVCLHEIQHALGFASMVTDNGLPDYEIVCSNSGNSFTLYDWNFGYYGDVSNPSSFEGQKLVVGTIDNPTVNTDLNEHDFPLRTPNVWLNEFGAPRNNALAGIPDRLVFTYPPSAFPSLSHLGRTGYFSRSSHLSPGFQEQHVIGPLVRQQELRRTWTHSEMRILIELGYDLNPDFAASNSLNGVESNLELLTTNTPAYRLDNGERPITSEDRRFAEMMEPDYELLNTAGATLTHMVNDGTVMDDQGDPITVMPGTLFGIRGVSDFDNNHALLELNEERTEIVYTPMEGYYGLTQFGYHLWDGREKGAMEIITIDVQRDPEYVVEVGEELVLNGGFEDATELWTQENTDAPYRAVYNSVEGFAKGTALAGGHPHSNAYNNWLPFAGGVVTKLAYDQQHPLVWGMDNHVGGYNAHGMAAPGSWFPNVNSAVEGNERYSRLEINAPLFSSLKSPLIAEEEGEWNYYNFSCKYAIESGWNPAGDTASFLFRIVDYPQAHLDSLELQGQIIYWYNIPYQTTFHQGWLQEFAAGPGLNYYYDSPEGEELWHDLQFGFYYCGDVDASYFSMIGYAVGSYFNVDDLSLVQEEVDNIYTIDTEQQTNGYDASIYVYGDKPISVSWQGPGVDGANTNLLEELGPGTYIATLLFEGGCSLEETIVIDALPVSVICPENEVIYCTEELIFDEPVGINLCLEPMLTYVDMEYGDNCELHHERTWSISDMCGNLLQCTQTITMIDTVPPLIVCPLDLELSCEEMIPEDPAISADDCSTISLEFDDEYGGDECVQLISRTWISTDLCGNSAQCVQTITIVDTIPPTIVCPPDLELSCEEMISEDPANTSDDCSTVSLAFTDEYGGDECAQFISRTWISTDICENSAQCIQTITLLDTIPPSIVCPPDLELFCGDTIPVDIPEGEDNCGAVSFVYTDLVVGDECDQEITRVWTATDDCGNSSECTQLISITPDVGVGEFEDEGFLIYPNPANEFVHLVLSDQMIIKTTEIRVFAADGKLVSVESVADQSTGQLILDSRDWAKGLYVVQLHGPAGAIASKKVEISR